MYRHSNDCITLLHADSNNNKKIYYDDKTTLNEDISERQTLA